MSPTKHLMPALFGTLFEPFLQWCRLYIKFGVILDKIALNLVLVYHLKKNKEELLFGIFYEYYSMIRNGLTENEFLWY